MKRLLALTLISGIILCTACSSNETSSVNISSESSSAVESEMASETSDSDTSSDKAEESSAPAENGDLSTDALCEAVLNSVEFPAMAKTEMTEMLEMIMDFSGYGIEEYTVYQQAMSVHLCEVIVIRTSDVKATTDALEQRKDVLINQLAFYPEQQESAKNTIVGSKNNICYLITHVDAKNAEKALLQKI